MLFRPEVIGHPDCPIFKRWTLWPLRRKNWQTSRRVMVHHFLAHADDRDLHDHPWDFWTFVLKGSYDDITRLEQHERATDYDIEIDSSVGDWDPFVKVEHMRSGMLRYRPARHVHRTRVGPNGCWTIVVASARKRDWGFWRDGAWWHRSLYEKVFGPGMRCE